MSDHDQSIERAALWRASFPHRVWEQGEHGWSSREPTAEDRERRRDVAEGLAS